MIIDFKQLAKMEKTYNQNNQHVSLNTLQAMIDQVMGRHDIGGLEVNHDIATETLKELGILKETNKSNVELLKS